MKTVASVVVALAVSIPLRAPCAAPEIFRLKNGRDAYFVENNLVYRCFLELMHDGSYRQIDQDRTRCDEVDQGTWEQTSTGTVQFHSTRRALRFRALLGGPLVIVLDSQEKLDDLARQAVSIRRFLASTGDTVFDARTINEFGLLPGMIAVRDKAETFRRDDLESLLRQIDHANVSERTGTYTFTLSEPTGSPALLILQDAVFKPEDLPRVRRDYRIRSNAPPPFYFAQVDARVYAREVGTWQALRFLGGTE